MLITTNPLPKCFVIGSVLLCHTPLYAQLVPDHTLGTVVNPVHTETGTHFSISAGRQEGDNVFHSFQSFNVHPGEQATFTGPDSIHNILARVTGGAVSLIDGGLDTTIPNANLYLLNPNGIRLGEHANLNIPGAFYASTAAGIQLGKDGAFLANPSNRSEFTSAPPSAFGFLDNSPPATIDIQGNGLTIKNRTFYVPNGQINVTDKGNLRMEDSTLYAPNGQIDIRANDGELRISQSSRNTLGKVDINNDGTPETPIANVDVSGKAGGKILIHAGQLVLDKGSIFADTCDKPGLGIEITVTGKMLLTNGARVTADNKGSNQGGRITITTNALQLQGWDSNRLMTRSNFSTIATNNYGSGTGGEIQITTPTLEMETGIVEALAAGRGNAGNITIQTQRAILKDGGFINAGTNSSGQGGNITITATEKISLANTVMNSTISTAASSKSSGNAGNINLTTPQLILENGGEITSFSRGTGNAGSLNLNINNLSLKGKSSIATRADQAGGGDITLQVRNRLMATDDSWITAEAKGTRVQDKGGNLTITHPNWLILSKSQLVASADRGHGGNIEIAADYIIGNLRQPEFYLGDEQREALIQASYSVIDATSNQDIAGDIAINAQRWDFNGIPLLSSKFPNTKLLLSRCASFSKENLSRFIITSRDILPPTPEDLRR
jgi:filamentous hemagglutinin family protein